jgi:hypothetical protein
MEKYRKINNLLNIIIGSSIGVFLGNVIYYLLDFKYNQIKYDMQSAPLWVFMLPSAIGGAAAILICIVMKLLIKRKMR